ncbi:MAG: hypothetical protein N2037_00415 [Acidimicrobiales bacterium]|nr:hypothetical protein [Acidimicrobiales bacterium]
MAIGSATRESVAATSPQAVRGRRGPAFLLAGAAVLIVLVGVTALIVASSRSDPAVYRFVVPPGTGARIDAGETIELIPTSLDVRVGDELIVENQDDRNHVVGPFTVAAGETLQHSFSRPGVYEGFCTVHSANRVRITVR